MGGYGTRPNSKRSRDVGTRGEGFGNRGQGSGSRSGQNGTRYLVFGTQLILNLAAGGLRIPRPDPENPVRSIVKPLRQRKLP